MIKREDLKKGDQILIVPNSDYTRDNFIHPVEVVSIGPKFISVATKWYDGTYLKPDKFYNDKNMFEKDYSSRKLFLGTQEEYEEFKTMEKKAKDLYYELDRKFDRNLGYEKLKVIKAIIESDDLEKTLQELVKPEC